MAYVLGPIRFTGTIGDATFYKMQGEYHVRTKSSLTGKKFWKHPAFAGSRDSCKRFALGNKLASGVYRSLPKQQQHYALFCQLKTMAIHCLKLQWTTEQTILHLQQQAEKVVYILPKRKRRPRPKKAFPYALYINCDYIALTGGRLNQLLNHFSSEYLAEWARQVLSAHAIAPPAALAERARA